MLILFGKVLSETLARDIVSFQMLGECSNFATANTKYSRPQVFIGKVVLQLNWNRTSAWVSSCKFAAYFQNTFSREHLWVAASLTCFGKTILNNSEFFLVTLIFRNFLRQWWKFYSLQYGEIICWNTVSQIWTSADPKCFLHKFCCLKLAMQ